MNWSKLGVEDDYIRYGDGGITAVEWPVHVCDQVLSNFARRKLVRSLSSLGEQTQDFHEHEPIQDLIDPNLFPYMLPDPGPAQPHIVCPKGMDNSWLYTDDPAKSESDADMDAEDGKSESEDEGKVRKNRPEDLCEASQLRAKYRWRSTLFRVNGDRTKVAIVGSLHGVPDSNRSLRTSLSQLFARLLPGLAELGLKGPEYHVVVKSQTYHLPARTGYSGKWHIEGLNDDIEAVATYYCEVDDRLQGGALKFRNIQVPNPEYQQHIDDKNVQFDLEVPTLENRSVVFRNTLPHRLRRLDNATTHHEDLRRTMVSFFVKSRRSLPPLPSSPTLRTLEEAKRFRARIRQALSEEKSGWGYISFGNVGDQIFIPSLQDATVGIRKEVDACDLHHSHSDEPSP